MSFSFPISHRNHNLGQCPKHHEYDPVSIPTHFLYPNTMGSLGMNKYDTVSRVVEDSCSAHEHVIEQEGTHQSSIVASVSMCLKCWNLFYLQTPSVHSSLEIRQIHMSLWTLRATSTWNNDSIWLLVSEPITPTDCYSKDWLVFY